MAANSARDVGGRLMVLTIWGKQAAGGPYAAIAALTNIPATILAVVIYEFMFTDSSRVLPFAQRDFLSGHKAHLDRRLGGNVASGAYHPRADNDRASSSEEGKSRVELKA